jgi:hypothetical protein
VPASRLQGSRTTPLSLNKRVLLRSTTFFIVLRVRHTPQSYCVGLLVIEGEHTEETAVSCECATRTSRETADTRLFAFSNITRPACDSERNAIYTFARFLRTSKLYLHIRIQLYLPHLSRITILHLHGNQLRHRNCYILPSSTVGTPELQQICFLLTSCRVPLFSTSSQYGFPSYLSRCAEDVAPTSSSTSCVVF